MSRFTRCRFALILAAVMAGAALASGCATSSGANTASSHNWSPQEDRAYRRYLTEQHLPYQDFALLGGQQQNDYWVWRQHHPDAGS